MSIEERLREHFTMKAEAIDVDVPLPEAARSSHRSRRLVPALAAAAVVLVAIGGTALFVGGRGETGRLAQTAEPDVPAVTAATGAPLAPGLDLGSLEWAATPLTFDGDGLPGPILTAATDWGHVAMAPLFAPEDDSGFGFPEEGLLVWTSADGETWESVSAPMPAHVSVVLASHIVSTGARAVIVGTEIPTGQTSGFGGGTIVVYASADGRAWERQVLAQPSDPNLGPYEHVATNVVDVAAGPAGVIVRATAFHQIDVDAVARDFFGLAPDELDGWSTDEETIEIHLVDGESRSVTYAVLGIERRPGVVDLGTELVWVSEDGDSWSRFDGLTLPHSEGGAFAVSNDGFLLGGFGPELVFSTDGRAWEDVSAGLVGAVDVAAVAADERSAIVITRDNGGVHSVWESTDGRSWLSLGELPAETNGTRMSQLRKGPLGIIVTTLSVEEFAELTPEPDLIIRRGGRTLFLEFGAGMLRLVDDETGEELLAEPVDYEDPEPPPFIIFDDSSGDSTVRDPDTGEELFTFTTEDLIAAGEDVVLSGEAGAPGAPVSTVWHSQDGVEWSRINLGVSGNALYSSVAVGDDVILVATVEVLNSPPGLTGLKIWRGVPAG